MTTLAIQEPSETLLVNQFLLVALDDRWQNYRAELKRCRKEFSNEAVHDLRSASRRMLAFIRLLKSISPRPRLQKLTRAFKDQLDEFDDLRDIQVVLAEVSETVKELPQLQEFQDHLQSVEKGLLRTLRKRLRVVDLFDVSKRVRRLRESLKRETDNDLFRHSFQAVDEAFLLTKRRRDWVNPAQATSVHRVRIAFKTFRYMVEIIHPLLDDYAFKNLERMHDYQSLMGEIQDVEVILQALTDAPVNVASFDPEPVRYYYEQCHAKAISAYLEKMNRLDTFWRAAPDQPFPWEN